MAAFPGNASIWSTSCGALSDLLVIDAPPQRRVLYGRRRGRSLRGGQKKLMDGLLPSLAIDLPTAGELDLGAIFADPPRSVWLEIGFGGGEHLAALAERHPDTGLIGCEVFENGIAKLLGEIERRRLSNVHMFIDDARLLIAALPTATIARVFILFPDPWPKHRHHKRRIVSPDTLDHLARIMTGGAELQLATDDPGYFSWMLECVTGHLAFTWLARRPCDWLERPPNWLPTRYEEKARVADRPPFFLQARRHSRAKA